MLKGIRTDYKLEKEEAVLGQLRADLSRRLLHQLGFDGVLAVKER